MLNSFKYIATCTNHMQENFPKGNLRYAESVPDIQARTCREKSNCPKTIEHLGIILHLKYALNPQYAMVENEYLVNDLFNIYSCNVCCSLAGGNSTAFLWKCWFSKAGNSWFPIFFFFYLIGCQMQNFLWQKAPPVKGNPLTSQVPDNLFCGVFRETELPVFPTALKQEWQKDDAELASTVRAPGIPFAKWIPAAPQNSLQPSEMANWAWYLVAVCTEASNESQE